MIGGMSPETCWASFKYGIKFWCTVASCWIFYVNYTMMHWSTNIKFHFIFSRCAVVNVFPMLGTNSVYVRSYATWNSKKKHPVLAFCFLVRRRELRQQRSSFSGTLTLTLILLTWRIWWASNNASRWQMGFNSASIVLKTF